MIAGQDLYAVLEVGPSATNQQITAAYYAQVRKHPPEKDAVGFQRVQGAFEVLSDPESRCEYDEQRQSDPEVGRLIEEGRKLLEESDLNALAPLKRALMRKPDSLVVRDLFVRALVLNRDFVQAVRQARILVGRAPNNPAFHVRLGDVFRAADQDDDAEQPYREALRLDQETPHPVLRLAYLLKYLDRADEAIDLLEKAIVRDGRVDFDDFLFFRALCRIHASERQFDEVVNIHGRIRGILPPDPETRSYVAWSYYQDAIQMMGYGDFSGAFPLIEEAAELDSSLPGIELARARIRTNRDAMDQVMRLRDDKGILSELRYSVASLTVVIALETGDQDLKDTFSRAYDALRDLYDVEGLPIEENISRIRRHYPAVAALSKKFLDDVLSSYRKTEKRYVSRAAATETRREVLIGKHSVLISDDVVSYRDSSIASEAVTRVRWGVFKHYVNGLPVSASYGIWIGSSERQINIECYKRCFLGAEKKAQERYAAILEVLWKVVCSRLVHQMVVSLSNNQRVQIGSVYVDREGIWLIKWKFFKKEQVFCKWHEITYSSYDGSLQIDSKVEPKASVSLSYRDNDNTHILEAFINFLSSGDNYAKYLRGEFST